MSTEEKLDSDKTSDASDEGLSDEIVALAAEPPGTADDAGAGKRTIGLERWVQLGFVGAALLLVWLYDHLINAIWYVFADPNEAIVTAASVVVGIITAGALYANSTIYGLVHGVSEELSKVSWPTRKETSSSTIVVVITSIIAAVMLFLFDSVWSAVTDLVYKV